MQLTSDLLELSENFFTPNSLASENCFLDFVAWQKKYQFEILKIKNSTVIKVNKNNSYRFPLCENENDLINSINQLLEEFKSHNKILTFERITLEQKHFLKNHFENKFEFTELRGDADYLYCIDDLAFLKGRKFSKKRNHIHGFYSIYENYKIKKIEKSNVEQVINFVNEWFEKKVLLVQNGSADFDLENLQFEKDGIIQTLNQLDEFEKTNSGTDAIALYIEENNQNFEKTSEEIVGFTFGQRLGTDCYCTVFEKADEEIKGAYNLINQQFALYLKEKYPDLKYINRESDLNIPGLRKSKLSYNPCVLLEKFNASTIL